MDVDREEISTEQPKTHWFIDLDWYQQNNRSLSALSKSYLCPKCTKQLRAEEKEISVDKLLPAIKDCCSHEPGFITDQLPIMESAFRFFLANGNQPLDLEELSKQLSERRGGDTYRTSAEILTRLLENDQYYGLRQAKDQPDQANT